MLSLQNSHLHGVCISKTMLCPWSPKSQNLVTLTTSQSRRSFTFDRKQWFRQPPFLRKRMGNRRREEHSHSPEAVDCGNRWVRGEHAPDCDLWRWQRRCACAPDFEEQTIGFVVGGKLLYLYCGNFGLFSSLIAVKMGEMVDVKY